MFGPRAARTCGSGFFLSESPQLSQVHGPRSRDAQVEGRLVDRAAPALVVAEELHVPGHRLQRGVVGRLPATDGGQPPLRVAPRVTPGAGHRPPPAAAGWLTAPPTAGICTWTFGWQCNV